MSKIDTLRLAIAYIALLREVLTADCDPLTYVEKCLRGERLAERAEWNTSGKRWTDLNFTFVCLLTLVLLRYSIITDLTARLSWINWENLGVNPNRRSMLNTLTLADNGSN